MHAASDSAVTVDYATFDVAATAGEDYTAASGTLTFAAGETQKTISVRIIDDTVEDNQEKVGLSNPSGAEIIDGDAAGTIKDGISTDEFTAEFQQVPASHDCSPTFTFRLKFSEVIAHRKKRNLWRALSKMGANIKQVPQVDNRLDPFELTFEPTGIDDVTITLGPSPID